MTSPKPETKEESKECGSHYCGKFRGYFESKDWSIEDVKMMKSHHVMIEAKKGEK